METPHPTSNGDVWAKVQYTLLDSDQRSPNLPAETAETPYLVYASGWLTGPVELGARATVETVTGRLIEGTVVDLNPGDWHTFGVMHPEFRKVTKYITTLQRKLSEQE